MINFIDIKHSLIKFLDLSVSDTSFFYQELPQNPSVHTTYTVRFLSSQLSIWRENLKFP